MQGATYTTTSVAMKLDFPLVVFETRVGDVFAPAGVACNPQVRVGKDKLGAVCAEKLSTGGPGFVRPDLVSRPERLRT